MLRPACLTNNKMEKEETQHSNTTGSVCHHDSPAGCPSNLFQSRTEASQLMWHQQHLILCCKKFTVVHLSVCRSTATYEVTHTVVHCLMLELHQLPLLDANKLLLQTQMCPHVHRLYCNKLPICWMFILKGCLCCPLTSTSECSTRAKVLFSLWQKYILVCSTNSLNEGRTLFISFTESTHRLSASIFSLSPFYQLEKSLQLSSWRVHVCLSIGYLVRSMLHATVVVILQNKQKTCCY